jgi:hypothetical protein
VLRSAWHAVTSVRRGTPSIVSVRNSISKCRIGPAEETPQLDSTRVFFDSWVTKSPSSGGYFAIRPGGLLGVLCQ